MKLRTFDHDFITLKQARRMGAKLYYWVVFPQGTVKPGRFGGRSYSRELTAKTRKQAERMAIRYGAPYYQRVAFIPRVGRWIIRDFVDPKYGKMPLEEIRKLFEDKPELYINCKPDEAIS